MCEWSSVSSSGFYDWQNRKSCVSFAQFDMLIRSEIRSIFFGSRDTYGHRNIREELIKQGLQTSYLQVIRIMSEEGLKAMPFVKRSNPYGKQTLESTIAPNRLKRQFDVKKPDRYWAGDITYIWTKNGWMYLAIVVDLFSKKVVGWALSQYPDTSLIIQALDNAMKVRSPRRWRIMFHSDQGCQYGSKRFRDRLNDYGILQSMSRRGNCWDNAPVESLFGTLKQETGLNKVFANNSNELEVILFDWIECWYNSIRNHSTLGYISPQEFEQNNQAA